MILEERRGDLFVSSDSLAHCVSRNMRMGAGIALLFRQRFGRVAELLAQQVPVGGVASLIVHSMSLAHGNATLVPSMRRVYYLVTKELHWQKPTYDDLQRSLEMLCTQMREHGVTRLSIPRLGCGLDKLEWPRVRKLIEKVFEHESVHICVYDGQ
jgi:O-acetyl-ADP-ribose deacetylase (regulator of RNase III)